MRDPWFSSLHSGIIGFSALGVEYTPAWLHGQEFIERGEQVLQRSILEFQSSYAPKLEKTQPDFRKRLTSTRKRDLVRNDGDIVRSLELLAYDQLKRAKQFPARSSLRSLKEKHARELLQEVKRMRARPREH
jgi:hypothetical protein